MNTQNDNNARPSGQDAAGSAQNPSETETERLAKALGASCSYPVSQALDPLKLLAQGLVLARVARQLEGCRHNRRRVTIPCEFHVFLPKAETTMAGQATGDAARTQIWHLPIGDEGYLYDSRDPFAMPQWRAGETFQILVIYESRKTLVVTGELEGAKIETPEERLDWMPAGHNEVQTLWGRGFMTFDPRDCFLCQVRHSFGSMFLEPDLPVDFTACVLEAALGNHNLWEQGLVEFSKQSAYRGEEGGKENLNALVRAGILVPDKP